MTGAAAKCIWENVVEPARRESAKMRDGDPGAAFRYAGMVETLGKVRIALVTQVVREEEGQLAEITREYLAMEKEVKKGAQAS